MDDVFKKEVLSRLDKIIGLLSVSCALSCGSLDRPKAESAIRQILGKKSETPQSEQYRINDEMQDDYLQAMQRWKEQKSP